MPLNGRSIGVSRETWSVQEAEELIVFADGLEEAGQSVLAARCRIVGRELIWAIQSLEAERSARVAIQRARDRLLGMLGKKEIPDAGSFLQTTEPKES